MNRLALIEKYLAGSKTLREAVAGMTMDGFDTKPFPGKWSVRQVVSHLADCELVYAERMKRVIAEEAPDLADLDPDTFAARLAYEQRDVEEELQLIEAVRAHMARILRAVPAASWERTGTHATDGPLTLAALLERITDHIGHHARFITEKRAANSSANNVDEASDESFPASDPPAWTGVTGP